MSDREALDRARHAWEESLRTGKQAVLRLQKIFAAQQFFVDVHVEMEPESSASSDKPVSVYWLGNREPPCFFADYGDPDGQKIGYLPTGIPTSAREYASQAYVLEAAPRLFALCVEAITRHADRVEVALDDLDHFLSRLAPTASSAAGSPEPTQPQTPRGSGAGSK
jgi:hypothetical protein